MTIDTSPDVLARVRAEANQAMIWGKWDGIPNISAAAALAIALINALEAAREKVEILEAEIRVMRKLPMAIDAALNQIPAAAPPVGTDTYAARETGETFVRERVAQWMIKHSYATGHGDTLDDLLRELIGQAIESALGAQIDVR